MRTKNIVLTLTLVAAIVLAPVGTVTAQENTTSAETDTPVITGENTTTPAGDEVNSSENDSEVKPGERLSGVLGMQQANIQGDIDNRAYGLQIAKAQQDDERADVVSNQVKQIKERLAEAKEEKSEIKADYTEGNMTEGKYNAKMATLSQRVSHLEDRLDRAENHTIGIPQEVLEKKGINISEVSELKKQANSVNDKDAKQAVDKVNGKHNACENAPLKAQKNIKHCEPEESDESDESDDDSNVSEIEANLASAQEELKNASSVSGSSNAEVKLAENNLRRAQTALDKAMKHEQTGQEDTAEKFREYASDRIDDARDNIEEIQESDSEEKKERRERPEQNSDAEQTENNVTAKFVTDVVRGEEATVKVVEDGEAVPNATVVVDDESTLTTAENGTVTFNISSEVENVDVGVFIDSEEVVEIEYELGDVEEDSREKRGNSSNKPVQQTEE